jgi:hypothetical protein
MITPRDILDYEIRSSWWACLISNPRLQDLAASYFAWKVRRKLRRYRLTASQSTGTFPPVKPNT